MFWPHAGHREAIRLWPKKEQAAAAEEEEEDARMDCCIELLPSSSPMSKIKQSIQKKGYEGFMKKMKMMMMQEQGRDRE